MPMYRENVSCKWHFMESDCRKCLLLGYHYICGSQECEEARRNEENNKSDYTARIWHKR